MTMTVVFARFGFIISITLLCALGLGLGLGLGGAMMHWSSPYRPASGASSWRRLRLLTSR
jgi:hypothetical protein